MRRPADGGFDNRIVDWQWREFFCGSYTSVIVVL